MSNITHFLSTVLFINVLFTKGFRWGILAREYPTGEGVLLWD